jgi:hypothetical protein
MRRMIFRCMILVFAAGVATTGRADMVIESLDGPVTSNEIHAFKEHLRTIPIPQDNTGNAMVYGSGGNAVESLGDVYGIRPDREILDRMLAFTDRMLAARNDPHTGRILWTGRREPVWPNKRTDAADAAYSGTENGDVIAHIAYAAELILRDKTLWNRPAAGRNGVTYLERATTYVRECDKTIDTFLLPWWVDRRTHRYRFPDSDLYAALGERYARDRGKPVPWNQQMMLNGAFGRLAFCHELLGDDPNRVERYDAIVKASADWFRRDLTIYPINGRDCCKWSYVAEGKSLRHVEDTGHAAYDMYFCRMYASGRYGIPRETMVALADTALLAIYKGNNRFAWRVDGSQTTRSYLPGTFLYLAEFRPELYRVIGAADLERAKRDPSIAARILRAKHLLHCESRKDDHRSVEK